MTNGLEEHVLYSLIMSLDLALLPMGSTSYGTEACTSVTYLMPELVSLKSSFKIDRRPERRSCPLHPTSIESTTQLKGRMVSHQLNDVVRSSPVNLCWSHGRICSQAGPRRQT